MLKLLNSKEKNNKSYREGFSLSKITFNKDEKKYVLSFQNKNSSQENYEKTKNLEQFDSNEKKNCKKCNTTNSKSYCQTCDFFDSKKCGFALKYSFDNYNIKKIEDEKTLKLPYINNFSKSRSYIPKTDLNDYIEINDINKKEKQNENKNTKKFNSLSVKNPILENSYSSEFTNSYALETSETKNNNSQVKKAKKEIKIIKDSYFTILKNKTENL